MSHAHPNNASPTLIAALKSLHVVPKTSSPQPASATPPERDIEDMSREELLAIVRAQKKNIHATQGFKQEGRLGVKHEADDENAIQDPNKVAFVSRKRVKCVPTEKDEVIELD